MSQRLGSALSDRKSDRRCAPLPDCLLGDSLFAFRKCPNTQSRLDLAGIRKLQPLSRNRMDAGTVPELSAKRNRFRRLPLSGCVAHRKRREYRSGLRIFPKSGTGGRSVARNQFVERSRARLDLSSQSKREILGCVKIGQHRCSFWGAQAANSKLAAALPATPSAK